MPNQSSPSSRRRGRASGGRTRSQSISRMQRAQALLNDEDKNGGSKAMTQSGQTSDSFDSGVLECRSDRSGGEMSSDLLNPRWRRLILAVSRLLAQRLSDATPVCDGRRAREMAEFVHTDATGGGSQMDLHQCFKGALEAMELSDKSTGFVLIGAYYYLQADDLMLTTQTWRSLVVTSLLVATNELCERAEREVASGKLRRSVAHWWSEDRADRAFQVFKLRDAFVRAPLNQQKIVALYFDLRARSLDGLNVVVKPQRRECRPQQRSQQRQPGLLGVEESQHHQRRLHIRPLRRLHLKTAVPGSAFAPKYAGLRGALLVCAFCHPRFRGAGCSELVDVLAGELADGHRIFSGPRETRAFS
ncbi:unnamed protein product [Prorocentrum cordatum]|uniref:Cyclin N-terminal domain-containing protein n=1 Tax=Prorocentrum cordatum TaxID=2364126 RepID=A0ABN9SA01_9DINO|nr:unnamed protein product [Polarella glacialis]